MSDLAVKGCTVEITTGQTASSKIIVTQPSEDITVNDKGVYFGDIDVQLSAITHGAYVCETDTITISGTADGIRNDNDEKAVQKGDSGSKEVTLKNPQGSEIVEVVTIKITDAGQTDVSQLDD